jgi:hypothetical protein
MWIILILSGKEKGSKHTYDEILSKLVKSKVSLITIGLGIEESFRGVVSNLCAATPRGRFFETDSAADLTTTFAVVKNWINFSSFIKN